MPRTGVTISGRPTIGEKTVLTILDEEARKAETRAKPLILRALHANAPRGTGHHTWGDIHLADAFRFSVRREPHGVVGVITRQADAWYGRIVEKGRVPGTSRYGRHYPGARANPFVERSGTETLNAVYGVLAEGADHAAARIANAVVVAR